MPPKKGKGGGKKGAKNTTQTKNKAKMAADKTFGMKNKNKSKKVQQYIQQVKKEASRMNPEEIKAQKRREAEKEAKRLANIRKREADALMNGQVIIKQKPVPPGVDPKSIVCEFFKANKCTKGRKCKFAHDLHAGRKVEKRDLYQDVRQKEKEEKEQDTMDKWDDAKLADVINQKRDAGNRNLPTKIVCKYFLDAIEKSQYGWFWECPNGGKKCQYMHALPPGFVLKKNKNKDDEDKGPTLEELIEEQRKKIGVGTPITTETFDAWKRRKLRDEARAAEAKQKEREAALSKGQAKMSGREAFAFDPTLFGGDDDDDDFDFDDLSDNEKDGDDDDDTEAKVWESNTYSTSDYRHADDEDDDDELDAVAYARRVAQRLGLTMKARKTAGSDDEEEHDDNDDNNDDDDDDNAKQTSDGDTGATEKSTADNDTSTASTTSSKQTPDSNAKSDKDAADKQGDAAPAVSVVNAAVFTDEALDDLPDDFSDED